MKISLLRRLPDRPNSLQKNEPRQQSTRRKIYIEAPCFIVDEYKCSEANSTLSAISAATSPSSEEPRRTIGNPHTPIEPSSKQPLLLAKPILHSPRAPNRKTGGAINIEMRWFRGNMHIIKFTLSLTD